MLLILNQDCRAKLFPVSVESKSGKSVKVGNDKTLDIAADNSFQNGFKLSPSKIEPKANFCDDFALWVTCRKHLSLSVEVISVTGCGDSSIQECRTSDKKPRF